MPSGTDERPIDSPETGASLPGGGTVSDPIFVKDPDTSKQNETLEKIAKHLSQLSETNKILEKISVASASLDINQRIQSLQDAIVEGNKLEWSEDRKKYEELKKAIEEKREKPSEIIEDLGLIGSAIKYIGKAIPTDENKNLYEASRDWLAKSKQETIKAQYPEAAAQAEKDIEDAKKLRELRKQELKDMEALREGLQPFVQEFLKSVKNAKTAVTSLPEGLPPGTAPVVPSVSATEPTTQVKPESELDGVTKGTTTPSAVIEPEKPVAPKKETFEPQLLKVELVKIDEKILEKLVEIFKKNIPTQESETTGTGDILGPGGSVPTGKIPRVPVPAINAATIAALKTVGLYTAAGAAALAVGAGIGYVVNNVANNVYEGITGEKTESVIGEGASRVLGYKDTIKAVTKEEVEERRRALRAEEEKTLQEATPEKRAELLEQEKIEQEQYKNAAIKAGLDEYTFKGITYPISQVPVTVTPSSTEKKSPFMPPEIKAAPALTVPTVVQATQNPVLTEPSKAIESQPPVAINLNTGSRVEGASTSPVINLNNLPAKPGRTEPSPDTKKSLDILNRIYLELKNLNVNGPQTNSTVINGSGTSYAFSYNLNAGTGITSSRKESSGLINKYIGLI